MPGPGPYRGVVSSFDAERGLGVVRRDGDGHCFGFHCTPIADGSRDIEPDAAVTFGVFAGHLGRWEAGGLARLATTS